MSKESLRHIDDRIVFKETFQSEQNTRRLGGVPTDVDYSNGVGSFNGTSSSLMLQDGIQNHVSNTEDFSIIIKVKANDLSTQQTILNSATVSLDRVGISINSGTLTAGVLNSVGVWKFNSFSITDTDKHEYVLTWIASTETFVFYKDGIVQTGTTNILATLGNDAFYLGSRNGGADVFFNGLIDLIEIYKGTLTAEEVSNLYNNRTYHELPDKISDSVYKILDVAAFGGVLENKMSNGGTIPEVIPTDIDIKKVGSNTWSPDFNGSTSKIDCGNYDDLTGDITVLAWVNPRTAGNANYGEYVTTDTGLGINLRHNNSLINMQFSSDGISFINFTNVNNGIKSSCICIKRLSNGTATIYINGVQIATGTSGIPVNTNLYIGGRDSGARVVDSKIPRTVIYKGILSLEQITQFYTNTRRYYE